MTDDSEWTQGSSQNANEYPDYVEHGLNGYASWSSTYELYCWPLTFFLVGILNNSQKSVYVRFLSHACKASSFTGYFSMICVSVLLQK